MDPKSIIRSQLLILGASLLAWSCASTEPDKSLNVAAAASLTGVFQELAEEFEEQSGITITPSFAATGQLAQQIRNGAPYDVFTAADALHIDALIEEGYLLEEGRVVYALGELILVQPANPIVRLQSIEDLLFPEIERIAIANPEHAPYGIAAKEALVSAGLWEDIKTKVIFGETVKQAAMIVATGNAEAGVIARSVLDPSLEFVEVIPAQQHHPILHLAAMHKDAVNAENARAFLAYLTSPGARKILQEHGFMIP